jgi:2,3-bisphosphoglycerate-dependent phosphoglycerate mutase
MLQEIYLVRHAAPDRTTGVPYNIEPGPPLTALGQLEARQVAAWLAARGIERIIASPFARTAATADAIAEALELDVDYVAALREGGPGESLEQVQARIAELYAQLDDSALGVVALVTHGACVRGLLFHTTAGKINLAGHFYDHGNHAPTAGVWHGQRTEAGWRWELAFRPAPEPPTAIAEAPRPLTTATEWV